MDRTHVVTDYERGQRKRKRTPVGGLVAHERRVCGQHRGREDRIRRGGGDISGPHARAILGVKTRRGCWYHEGGNPLPSEGVRT